MRAVAIYIPVPTSGVRGPDTLWRVPWTPLFGSFLFPSFQYPYNNPRGREAKKQMQSDKGERKRDVIEVAPVNNVDKAWIHYQERQVSNNVIRSLCKGEYW